MRILLDNHAFLSRADAAFSAYGAQLQPADL
jgi:hypothetical protein